MRHDINYERDIPECRNRGTRKVFAAAAALFLLASCAAPSPQEALSAPVESLSSSAAQTDEQSSFDAFLNELDQRRGESLSWSKEEKAAFSAYMPDYTDQLTTYTDQEIALLTQRREPSSVSIEQAREDVEAFFALLRTTYGGYDYFGGDETFQKLQDQALAGLPDSGEMTDEDLKLLLYGTVQNTVRDGHFMIGDCSGIDNSRQHMFYVPDLYFETPDGLDPAYVRATIGPSGAVAYCFAALSGDGGDLPRTAVVPDGETVELNWIRSQPFGGWGEDDFIYYEKRIVDGLPVLICENLDDSQGNQPQLEALGQSGGEYRETPVFAVDLRGNWGGQDGYAQQWIKGFALRWPQSKMIGGVKFSQLCMAVRGDYESQRQRELNAVPGAWGAVISSGARLYNENIILLLTDCNTASAAEDFVSHLRAMKRVVTVGSNTAGCQTFGNVMNFYLPRSGLRIQIGASFLFWDTAENREGTGYLPDLWVNPSDALDAVVRLCGYYGLI